MDKLVIDTDVVSFALGDSRAEQFRDILQSKTLVVSFMTVAELDRWALERNWGAARKSALESLTQSFVVIPSTRDLCLRWAEVMCDARRRGRVLSVADA